MDNIEKMHEDRLDRTKYFLDKYKKPIYAPKGGGHKVLANTILWKENLNNLYFKYRNVIPPQIFLTYCGYVLVDESGEDVIITGNTIEEEFKELKYIIYCSEIIDNKYVDYLKNKYNSDNVYFEDSYEWDDMKETINEIIQKCKNIREQRKQYDER